jgi:predicted metalloenzyme YecM
VDLGAVIGDYEPFVRNLVGGVVDAGIETEGLRIDHVCYRVVSYERYEEMKRRLRGLSRAVCEEEHNGRPIAVFQLVEPMMVDDYVIPLVELPAPHPDKAVAEGLEHIEMVVPYEFGKFARRHKKLWSDEQLERKANPMVYLDVAPGRSVRFHPRSLMEVLALQGQTFTVV